MGSAEDDTAPPAKTPPPTTTAKAQEPAASLPPAANPAAYSTDWATGVHAYYSGASSAGGTPPPFYAPPVWGSQMMSPFGNPIPFSPMYYPMYAHPSVATAAGYPVAEPGSNKSGGGGGGGGGGGPGKSGDGGKVISGSADDYGSQSGGESGSEGSSDAKEDGNESQDATRKRSFGDAFTKGESSQPATASQNNSTNAETPYSGRPRTVPKLPVSAPGRATLPGPATNLNIGMEVWSAPHVGTAPKDERELKRERRKQSNRESARKSRLRKQQECEDLTRKVTELSSKNSALKVELEQLNKACKVLEAENASITEDLNRMAKTGVQSQFEGINSNS